MAPPSDEVVPLLVVGPHSDSGPQRSACETLYSQRGKGLHFPYGGCAVLSQVLYFAQVRFLFFPPWNVPDRQAGAMVSLSSLYRETRKGRGRIFLLWASAACILGLSDRRFLLFMVQGFNFSSPKPS